MTTRVRHLKSDHGMINNSRRMQNTNHQDAYVATTISAVNSTNSFDDSATSLPSFGVGQVIEVSGFENNSRRYGVVSSSSSSLVVDGMIVTDESAGEEIFIRSV